MLVKAKTPNRIGESSHAPPTFVLDATSEQVFRSDGIIRWHALVEVNSRPSFVLLWSVAQYILVWQVFSKAIQPCHRGGWRPLVSPERPSNH